MMNDSNQQLTVYLLRHGETTLQNRLVGATDPQLSERGWQQMMQAAENLRFDQVITSPLQRCKAFALSLAAQRSVTVTLDSELKEINFGDWDGKHWDDIPREAAENYFRNPWQHSPPNAESLIKFDERIYLTMEARLRAPTFGKWLLIVHGGVIKSIIAWAMGLNDTQHQCYNRIHIPHASVSQLTVNWHQQQRFITINSINQNG